MRPAGRVRGGLMLLLGSDSSFRATPRFLNSHVSSASKRSPPKREAYLAGHSILITLPILSHFELHSAFRHFNLEIRDNILFTFTQSLSPL